MVRKRGGQPGNTNAIKHGRNSPRARRAAAILRRVSWYRAYVAAITASRRRQAFQRRAAAIAVEAFGLEVAAPLISTRWPSAAHGYGLLTADEARLREKIRIVRRNLRRYIAMFERHHRARLRHQYAGAKNESLRIQDAASEQSIVVLNSENNQTPPAHED